MTPSGRTVWPESDAGAKALTVSDRHSSDVPARPSPDAERHDWPTQSARDWQRLKDFWDSMPLGETALEVTGLIAAGLVAAAVMARFAPLVLAAMKSKLGVKLGAALSATTVGFYFNQWFDAAWTASDDPTTRDQKIAAAQNAFKIMAKAYSAQQLQAKSASAASQSEAATGQVPGGNLPVSTSSGGDLVPMGSSIANTALSAVSHNKAFGIRGADGHYYPTPSGGSFESHERAPVLDRLESDRVVDIRVQTTTKDGWVTLELHTQRPNPLLTGDQDILVGKITYRELENGGVEIAPGSKYLNPGYYGVGQRLAAERTELGPRKASTGEKAAGHLPGIDRFKVVPQFDSLTVRGASVEDRRAGLFEVMKRELEKIGILPLKFELNPNAGEQFAFDAEDWSVRIDSLVLTDQVSSDWIELRMRYAFTRAVQCWEVMRYVNAQHQPGFAPHAVTAAIADTSTMSLEHQAFSAALHESMTSPESTNVIAAVKRTSAERERQAELYNAVVTELSALEGSLTPAHLAQRDAARWKWHDAHMAAMKAADEQSQLPHEIAAWKVSRAATYRKPQN